MQNDSQSDCLQLISNAGMLLRIVSFYVETMANDIHEADDASGLSALANILMESSDKSDAFWVYRNLIVDFHGPSYKVLFLCHENDSQMQKILFIYSIYQILCPSMRKGGNRIKCVKKTHKMGINKITKMN